MKEFLWFLRPVNRVEFTRTVGDVSVNVVVSSRDAGALAPALKAALEMVPR